MDGKLVVYMAGPILLIGGQAIPDTPGKLRKVRTASILLGGAATAYGQWLSYKAATQKRVKKELE